MEPEPAPVPEVGHSAYAGQGAVAVVLYEYEVIFFQILDPMFYLTQIFFDN